MITFKQFLEESQNYPLYHATSIRAAIVILQYGQFNGSSSEASEPWGLSTTRDIKTAWKFGALKNNTYNETVVFELDRTKLSYRYKIVPYNYWGTMANITRFQGGRNKQTSDFNEYEEKVVFKKGSMIESIPYIKKVMVYGPSFYDNLPLSASIIVNSPKLYIYTLKKFINK